MQNWLPFTLTLSFCMTFRTFSATLLCLKMYPSFAHKSKLLTILFLRCLLVPLPFAEPMPIIFAEGIKRPCYPSERLSYFYEGGGDRKELDNKRFTAPSPCTLYKLLTNFPLQLF
jgi:hypothetical protein